MDLEEWIKGVRIEALKAFCGTDMSPGSATMWGKTRAVVLKHVLTNPEAREAAMESMRIERDALAAVPEGRRRIPW